MEVVASKQDFPIYRRSRSNLCESPRLSRGFTYGNYARVPALTVAWPTVEQYHPDSYPLEILADLLADGKKAPFYKVIVDEEKLAPSVNMSSSGSELAGRFTVSVRGFAGTSLDQIHDAVKAALARFETEGFTEADLARVKAGAETSFYNGISSVLGKAFEMAQYNIFAGSPGYIEEDIARLLAVTSGDVMRVYDTYIKGRNFVATSFVPRGQKELVLSGAVEAEVVEEPIVVGREAELVLPPARDISETPSAFDRSVEPPFGEAASLPIPEVWTDSLANGLDVYGIENGELPLVRLTIQLKGGLLLDSPDKVGVASLMAGLMTEGTADRTPEELEEAIDSLGASINVSAGRETLTISANTLRRNFAQTMALVEEILLEPRWDIEEFDLARQRTANTLRQQEANPNSIAANAYNRLLYGRDHILSNNTRGTLASVESISIDDLKTYYARNVSPTLASMHVVGDIGREEVTTSLAGLVERWEAREVEFPSYTLPPALNESRIYFVDVPDASQSVIRVGALALAVIDPDYYPATVMNFRLGGGGFASQLLQVLREEKGYTYGVGSFFSGTDLPGPYTIATGVRANVTLESIHVIKDILEGYGEGFNEADLEATTSYLLRANARAFETPNAKINMLRNISAYGLPHDYVVEREQIVRDMTEERVQELARRYADASRMIYLVVGDARTQLARLNALGMGRPILIDRDANPLVARGP